jgi:hypothetical protein
VVCTSFQFDAAGVQLIVCAHLQKQGRSREVGREIVEGGGVGVGGGGGGVGSR